MSVLYETSGISQVDEDTIERNTEGQLSVSQNVLNKLLPQSEESDKNKYLSINENGDKEWKDVELANLADVVTMSQVNPVGNENPSNLKWYEFDNSTNTYVLTVDTTVDTSKTYYERKIKDGQYLRYNEELKKFENVSPITLLSLLEDVEITDPQNEDIFVYNNGLHKWVNMENNGSRFSIVVKSTDAKLQNDVTITIEKVDGGEASQSGIMKNGQVEFSVRHGGVWKIIEPVGGNFFFTQNLVNFGEYTYEISSYKIYGFHVDNADAGSGVPGKGVSYKIDYEGENPVTHEVISTKVSNYDYEPAYMNFDLDEWNWGSWNQNDFFIPRPCLLSQDCTHVIYLNPDNYAKGVNGNTEVEIFGIKHRIVDLLNGQPAKNADGSRERYYNAMMQWGREFNGEYQRIWYKVVPDSDSLDATSYSVYFASTKLDNDFHAWSFYNCDDELIPYFYTSIYNSSHFGVQAATLPLRSVSNSSGTSGGTAATADRPRLTSNTGYTQTLIPMAKLNNKNNKIEWYTDIFSDRILINFLLILLTRSLNIQDAVGVGYEQPAAATAATLGASGSGNRKGLFYGKYELADGTRNKNSVSKVFGMENYYGNMSSGVAGLIFYNGNYYVKMTYGTVDGSTSRGWNESTVVSPTAAVAIEEANNYICGTNINPDLKQTAAAGSKWNNKMMADGQYGLILPVGNTTDGANNKYYCDTIRTVATNFTRSFFNPHFGKLCNLAQVDGMVGPFSMDSNLNMANGAAIDKSTRLSCKPKSIPTVIQ